MKSGASCVLYNVKQQDLISNSNIQSIVHAVAPV